MQPAKIPTARPKLPSKRLLLSLAVLAVGGFILWWIVLWVSFSGESVRAQTIAALEQQLGRKVNQADDVQFSLFPIPTLVMNNVNAENDPRSRQPSMMRVPQVTATVHLYSLLNSKLYVTLQMLSPKVELETFDDGSSSWEIRSQDEEKEAAVIAGLEVVGGELHYSYPSVDRDIVIRQINANMHFPSDHQLESSGAMIISNAAYQFTLGVEGGGDDNASVNLTFSDGLTTLFTNGKWNRINKSFEGEQKLESADLGALIRNFVPKHLPPGQVAPPPGQQPAAPETPAFPVQWQSNVSYVGDKLTLGGITFTGDYIKGKGEVAATIATRPDITARFDFDKFTLDPLAERGIIYDILTHSESAEIVEGFKVNLPEGRKTALPRGMTFALTATSKELSLLSLPTKEMQLVAKLQDSKISVSQFSGKLPGDTQFIVKGDVEGSFEGLSLKGQLDVGGKEFFNLSPHLFGENLAMPERLKQFRGRANIFLTPDLTRLSEMIMRVEDYQLLGTILRQKKSAAAAQAPQAQPVNMLGGAPVPKKTEAAEIAFEGALRLDNLNFDEMEEAQEKLNAKTPSEYPEFLRVVKKWQSASQNASMDFKIHLFDFMLNGKKRPKATFGLAVNGGGVALNNLETVYNGTALSGTVGMAFPANGLPEVQADIKADHLDTKEFFEHDFTQDASFWRDGDGAWSKREFQLDWVRKLNGRLSLVMGTFSHEIHNLTDIFLEAEIKDSSLQISKFSAGLWGGELSARGQMLASKLPSVNGYMAFKNIDIVKLRPTTNLFGDLLGRISLSGEFTTTGVNPYIAVQNAQGVIAVSGRGITITGFNLANMVRAANTVRTVSDIDKLVQFADQGGTTNVDMMQGNVNLAAGYLRSPGIMIGTKEGAGSINGQLSLLDWNLNTAITVYLTALQAQSPPSIRLIFAGPLNQAARTLDTQSLESFIAKQAAERILDTR